jgi:hypothetical protein
MAAKAAGLGHPDAAQTIVDDCYRLLGVDIHYDEASSLNNKNSKS